jgi:uncharacterized coiled-coil DUF342 family protein
LDSRYSDASSSGEEDEVDEGESRKDNNIINRMAQVGRSPLLYPRERRAGETETMVWERDALKMEVEELRDHIKDVWALKEQADKVTKERDALVFEAELNADVAVGLKKERDALRLEVEELQAQREESGELKKKLNLLMQQCEKVTKERDALLSRTQNKAVDKDTIKKFRETLKLEKQNVRDQHEATVLLEKQLNNVRKQFNNIAKEKDSFKLKSRHAEANCNAIRNATEALNFEIENLRAKCQDYDKLKEELIHVKVQCDDIAKERDSVKLRYRRSEANNKATRNAMEVMKVETEEIRPKLKNYTLLEKQLNTLRQQCETIEKEKNDFTLKAQKISESKRYIIIERDALKREAEILRDKIEYTDLLEKQIKATVVLRDNLNKERDLYKLKARWTAGYGGHEGEYRRPKT